MWYCLLWRSCLQAVGSRLSRQSVRSCETSGVFWGSILFRFLWITLETDFPKSLNGFFFFFSFRMFLLLWYLPRKWWLVLYRVNLGVLNSLWSGVRVTTVLSTGGWSQRPQHLPSVPGRCFLSRHQAGLHSLVYKVCGGLGVCVEWIFNSRGCGRDGQTKVTLATPFTVRARTHTLSQTVHI